MTRPLPRGRALVAGLLLILFTCLIAPNTAIAATPAPSDGPVYPEATEPSAEDDEGSVLLPTISAQEGNTYLAVTEAAQPLVDNQAILDAVREAMGESNAKLLIGVDKKPNSLKGAGQLVRGMLLFSDTSYLALADDWLENGKTLGYVADGWIVIGVMLPEETGGTVEVAVDAGRDVKGNRGQLVSSGVIAFAAGDYTEGINQVALTALDDLEAPADRTWMMYTALGVLGALILAVAVRAVSLSLRRKAIEAAQHRQKRAAELSHELADSLKSLRTMTLAEPVGQLAEQARGALGDAITSYLQTVQEPASTSPTASAGAQPEVSGAHLERLERNTEQAQLLTRGLKEFNSLGNLRGELPRLISAHRKKLNEVAGLLEIPGAGELACEPELRRILVVHTLALEKAGPEDLDELWKLWRELHEVTHRALQQAAAARVKIPAQLRESLNAAADTDMFAQIEAALAAPTGVRA